MLVKFRIFHTSLDPPPTHSCISQYNFTLTYLFTYILTYLLIYYMEQSPSWEANKFSANHEIPQILCNQKIHYHVHKCSPPVRILSQLDEAHALTSHFLKIHLSIMLPSTPGSSKWFLSLGFHHETRVYTPTLPHTSYMSRPSHSSPFDHPNIGSAVQIIKLLTT